MSGLPTSHESLPQTRRRWRSAGLDLALAFTAALLFWFIARDPKREDAIPALDEYGWIAASHATYEALRDGRYFDFTSWGPAAQSTTYGRLNPNLGKLFMGGLLDRWGYGLSIPRFLVPGSKEKTDRVWPQKRMASLAPDHIPYIHRMRRVLVFVGSLCAALTYVIGRMVGGRLVGATGAALFLASATVQSSQWFVGTDNLVLLASLISIIATCGVLVWLQRAKHAWRSAAAWVGLPIMAIALGMTVAVKLNGGLLTIVALLSLGVTSVIDARGRRGAMAAATVLAPALAFALFVFLMPQLHADVPERLQRLGQRWSRLTASQQARMPDVRLLTVSSRAKAAYAHAYPGFEWRPTQTRLLQCLLSIAGLGVVLSAWGAGVRRKTGSAIPCVFALWAMVVVTGTTLWAPLNWDRYFLQMAPPIAILQAVAIGSLLRQVPLRLARVRTAISSSDPGGKGEAGPIDGRKD